MCECIDRETNTLLSSLSETPPDSVPASEGLGSAEGSAEGSAGALPAEPRADDDVVAVPECPTVIIEIAVPGRDCPIKLKVFKVCCVGTPPLLLL